MSQEKRQERKDGLMLSLVFLVGALFGSAVHMIF